MSAPMREQVTLEFDGKRFAVDSEIASLVTALNIAGIRTVASCSGHGFRPGRISLADGRELFVLPSYEIGQWFETQFPRDINGDTAEERATNKASPDWQTAHSEPECICSPDWVIDPNCKRCS